MVQYWDNVEFKIVLQLVKEESHVRSLARSLRESRSTVQRRLDHLFDESVLDYKRKGRNKVFFVKKNLQARNYVFNAERYKQMELLKKYPKLTVLAEDLLRRCRERLIVIFGSYAKFTAGKDSDIDVYVETDDEKVKEEAELIHSKIKVKTGRFDPDSPLIKEIISNHVILRGVEDFYEKTRFLE